MQPKNYIKIEDLKDGYLYRIRARNGAFGIYIEKCSGFVLSRTKFGANFPFIEYHWDTGAPFGTVLPTLEIEKSPFDTSQSLTDDRKNPDNYYAVLEYLNKFQVPHEEERLLEHGMDEETIKRLINAYKRSK